MYRSTGGGGGGGGGGTLGISLTLGTVWESLGVGGQVLGQDLIGESDEGSFGLFRLPFNALKKSCKRFEYHKINLFRATNLSMRDCISFFVVGGCI